MKKNHLLTDKNRILSASIFALFMFVVTASAIGSVPVALFVALIAMSTPFIFRSSGVLATGAGGDLTEEEKLLKKIKDEVDGLFKGTHSTTLDRLKHIDSQLEALKAFGTVKEEVIEMKRELAALIENQSKPEEKRVSFSQALKAAFEEKSIKEQIESILKAGGKQTGPLRIEVKAAVTMQTDNTIGAGDTHYTLTSDTGIISAIRKRILRYLDAVAVGGLSVDRPYAMWIEELDEQGNPIFLGEGDGKTQLSVRYEEREKKAKKIAVYGKVTTEMLRYLPQLISYINNNLMKRMDIKTEDQLFAGDDTGDNLKGITEYATAFDGGEGVVGADGLVGKVPNPNNYDVLRAVALQVENSYGVGTKVFVSPQTIAEMDVEKDSQGRYILPPFRNQQGNVVAGLELIPTLGLPAGVDFVGGDLSVVNVQWLNQTGITIGLDGNDFTNNKKTILVEQELVQFVSANDTQVLVKGDFATAKALIGVV